MSKKVILIIVAVAVLIIGLIGALLFLFLSREGVAFNSGSFSATSGGVGFTVGIQTGSGSGVSNVENNTWRATPYRANGTSRIDYTFTSANLEAMTVKSTNSDGNIFLTLTQGEREKTFDITGEFIQNIDISDFEPGRIRLRLNFQNARNIDTLISW